MSRRPLRVLPGDRFGLLTVLHSAPSTGNGARYTCRCDCGGSTIAFGFNLLNGKTTSCGCKRGTGNATAWTPDEDELLHAHYPTGGVAAVIAAGVDRTPAAVHGRARVLGVTMIRRDTASRYRRLDDPSQHDAEHPLDWAAILTRMPPDLARQTLASLDEYRRQNGRPLWRPA